MFGQAFGIIVECTQPCHGYIYWMHTYMRVIVHFAEHMYTYCYGCILLTPQSSARTRRYSDLLLMPSAEITTQRKSHGLHVCINTYSNLVRILRTEPSRVWLQVIYWLKSHGLFPFGQQPNDAYKASNALVLVFKTARPEIPREANEYESNKNPPNNRLFSSASTCVHSITGRIRCGWWSWRHSHPAHSWCGSQQGFGFYG